jgi:uncharacterized damage-inducible protein DinB
VNARAFVLDQLQRAHAGPAWHGPSLREVLDGVDAARAAARPPGGGHSIWELVLHIAVWEDVARRRLEGDMTRPTDAEDWPAVEDVGEGAWRAALTRLEQAHAALRVAIAALPEERMDEVLRDPGFSIAHLLHGVVQHDLYHAGQIALLRKAVP